MNHIILIGFMGAGKTTIGSALSNQLGMEFIDTDNRIEELEQMTIMDIFEKKGEKYFRQLETNVLKELFHDESQYIISVGGGLPMEKENQELLKQLGTCIYLKATIETLCNRLQCDTKRPLLQGEDVRKKIETLMEKRQGTYEAISQYSIITDKCSKEAVVESIVEQVRNIRKKIGDL